jgi:hypothetical protein
VYLFIRSTPSTEAALEHSYYRGYQFLTESSILGTLLLQRLHVPRMCIYSFRALLLQRLPTLNRLEHSYYRGYQFLTEPSVLGTLLLQRLHVSRMCIYSFGALLLQRLPTPNRLKHSYYKKLPVLNRIIRSRNTPTSEAVRFENVYLFIWSTPSTEAAHSE